MLKSLFAQATAFFAIKQLNNSGKIPRAESNAMRYQPNHCKVVTSFFVKKTYSRWRAFVVADSKNAVVDNSLLATRETYTFVGPLALQAKSSETPFSKRVSVVHPNGKTSC